MRVPITWLNDYCEPPLDAAALAHRLAMTGTEVERVEHHGVAALENFVVGKVLERRRHPDAERLTVCMVDVGGSTPSQIVCGAPNVAAGQTVAVAKPGAVMPDGSKLGKARLRGVESNGMILAEDELAIGTEHAGIIVLDEDGLKPGSPLEHVLPISTDVLVLEVTPNRPDCLGIYGVAREVHAATGADITPAPWTNDPGTQGDLDGITITVENAEKCPRFTARIFEDVAIGPSPPWLKARLMAAGQRPISNVVDIANYVMLLTGQPLHAFDLDRIAGAQLTVRTARENETIETLDGQTRTLDPDMVLIEDAVGPTSIAGIMGGARSEVAPDTTHVLMEVANWNGPNIHRTSLKLGLRSEASSRFEKQLEPEQAMDAQAVATQLMIELCGATLRAGTADIGGPGPEPKTIRLREARVESLLGAPIAKDRQAEILRALEFKVYAATDGVDVTVPTFRRTDVTREADLIEEVARIDGLEKLPATLPSRHGASGRLTELQRLRRDAADALIAQGLDEIVGWSFTGPDLVRRLRLPHEATAVEIENPMSSEQARLRTTLLGSLLDVARRNRAQRAETLRLFEAGAVYLPDPGRRLPREPHHVGALLIGAVRPATWREPNPRSADFFAAKGALQGLLDRLGVPWSVSAPDEPEPFLHPGRAATIVVADQGVGWLGEIHPVVAADWDIEDTVAGFELDLDALAPHAVLTPIYEDLTSFPEVREDLAVIVSQGVGAARVLAVVREAGKPLLQRAEVFDVYRDPERLGEGNVSLAIRLSYRAPDRTLTDEQVAKQRDEIVGALESELGGRIRAS
jgi:phenylalanyl-tRNA synthetase beta chain